MTETFKEYEGDAEEDMVKRKKIVEVPSQEIIIQKIMQIKDYELRNLSFYLYMSDARISEALKLKYRDIIPDANPNARQTEIKYHYGEINSFTAKNRTRRYRTIPILYMYQNERIIWEQFKEFYEHKLDIIFDKYQYPTSRNSIANQMRDGYSFKLMVQDFKTGQKEMQEVRLHPHLFRHFRLTHFVTIYGYEAFDLMKVAGWSSIKPADTYVAYTAKKLVERAIANVPVRSNKADINTFKINPNMSVA